ncbi:MAG: putative bifunctional diguanylate cyclase/phosphodiesterase [Methylococcaceae bacterium]
MNLSTNRPKILVVDDLSANLLSMKTLLKKVDVEVITADTGNTALSLALQHNLALILLDINMPVMDGFEVATLLSETEETKNIPIIFVTAMDHSEERLLQGYGAGAVDYIEKPVTPQILLAKVNIFINQWTLKTGLEEEIDLRKIAEKKIDFLAHHDPLTKLANRRELQSQLKSVLDHATRKKERFAVLFLDLDGFKKINDELGHEIGDAVLIGVASRFQKLIRSSDILSRYGGDEFIIVLSDIAASLDLSTKLSQLINTLSEPFYCEEHVAHVGVSIGVAIYPEHGETGDTLISRADNAMYQAKADGKNNFKFFSDDLNQQLQRKLLLEKHLHHALKKQEFEVYYQPLIDIATDNVIGAEALLRWHNSFLGSVSPVEFIPIAEATGQISEMGIWVLHQVLPLLHQFPTIHIAINASSLQFKNSLLYDEIKSLIQHGQLDARMLEVEITEGLLLDDSHSVTERIENMHQLGINLSVDDFGTGYSSLSYLKDCPVSTVKIDRSFITDTPSNADNCALVKAIIVMAHALNLKVIAEGVETQAQWNFLKKYQCDIAQGYFKAKPMPLLDFEKYLIDHI